MTDHLRLEDLLEIAESLIPHVVVRDLGMLASAVGRPSITVFGADAYPSLTAKAAALLHSLARNHALLDGNTRLAWAAARIFCLMNGADLRYDSVDEAEALVLAVAVGDIDVPEIAEWIADRLTPTTD